MELVSFEGSNHLILSSPLAGSGRIASQIALWFTEYCSVQYMLPGYAYWDWITIIIINRRRKQHKIQLHCINRNTNTDGPDGFPLVIP